jgi:hypothetical protein
MIFYIFFAHPLCTASFFSAMGRHVLPLFLLLSLFSTLSMGLVVGFWGTSSGAEYDDWLLEGYEVFYLAQNKTFYYTLS